MNSSIRLDHLVIAVHDLESAARDYTRLGFTVTPGGRHTHAPTRNALVYFDDGAYIELIQWLEPARGEKWYERLSHAGEGIVDFALCPDDVTEVIARTNQHGVAYASPVPGSRVQPDGQEIRWLLGWAGDETLPFLCADVTDRKMRVPVGVCRQHANSVTGIAEIEVAVHSLDTAAPIYERLLQTKAIYASEADAAREGAGSHIASFHIGETNLLLAEPGVVKTSTADALHDQLIRRGPGAYRIRLKASVQQSVPLDQALTHGAAVLIG